MVSMMVGIGLLFRVWRWCIRGACLMTSGAVVLFDVDAWPLTLGAELGLLGCSLVDPTLGDGVVFDIMSFNCCITRAWRTVLVVESFSLLCNSCAMSWAAMMVRSLVDSVGTLQCVGYNL